jgi:hypothetical protein
MSLRTVQVSRRYEFNSFVLSTLHLKGPFLDFIRDCYDDRMQHS